MGSTPTRQGLAIRRKRATRLPAADIAVCSLDRTTGNHTDLKLHDCVMLNARNNETDWDLVCGRKKARVHVSGPISSRDFNSVSTFVYRGRGIGLLPSTYCDEALASGALVRLLPNWSSAQIPVFAVYSNRKFLPLRLSVFLNALAAWPSPLWVKE